MTDTIIIYYNPISGLATRAVHPQYHYYIVAILERNDAKPEYVSRHDTKCIRANGTSALQYLDLPADLYNRYI